jgi:LysM repeat protein
MANRKRSVILFSLFVVTAIFISACERSYSTVPLETPAADATSNFVAISPLPSVDNPMAMVEELSTGTALAETGATEETSDAPTATQEAESDVTPTTTPTLGGGITPSATQPAPTTIVDRPASYALQKGEFPYCIARRFNVDPAELLNLNGLTNGEVYYPNLTLTIPQTGNPFPGTRALRSHPDTYTVADASLSLYAIACVYGDVDPAAIVSANSGLSLNSPLTVGQQISIP